MSEPLVIVGNGMVAARLAEELSRHALGRYAVAVIGEEPLLAYNRVLLSSLLAGEIEPCEIELKSARWWRDHGVTLRYGCRSQAIDVAARAVTLADGSRLRFSKLVLATGSRSIRPAWPGINLPGVLTFRDAADAAMITAASGPGARAVVVGGGLLGIEAAYGLAKGGTRVTLVHLMDRLMERQLDARAARLLRAAVEARGIEVLLEVQTEAILGHRRAAGIRLRDGREIRADLVVVAVGITPNVELARAALLNVERGIVVDDCLATSAPEIYAIGECAQHRGQCYGLVEPGHEQARVLAARLAGQDVRYGGSVPATNLKISGVAVFSAGDFMGAPGTEDILFCDPGIGTYKKLVLSGGCLVGAVLVGDSVDALWYLDLIRSGAAVDLMRDDLMFGRAHATRAAA